MFELVAQLNHFPNFASEAEGEIWRWRIVELNLRAGLKAKEATAFGAAVSFFEKGRLFAPDDAWSDRYETMYALYLNGSEAAFLNGDFAVAEGLYDQALSRADGALDRSRIFCVRATQYQLQGRNHEALEVLRTCLTELGWDMPERLSEHREFEHLLKRIVEIIAENAGADRGALYLPNDEAWTKAASCRLGDGNATSDAASTKAADHLEQALVRYVARSREPILIDKDTPPPVILDGDDDADVGRTSRLIVPAMSQGELTAVLYLENSLASGVFDKDRMDVVSFLTAQAAIALQNARLFGDLEHQAMRLEQALEKEKGLSALQRQFVAMVCREFRTPLAIIDGNAQRILKRAETIAPDRLRSVLEKMRGSVDRLITLIETVPDAAHLEEGRIRFEPVNCDLRPVLDEIASGYREVFPSHSIHVETSCLTDLVMEDANLVRQIISNLLSNALKYSPEGSEVCVSSHVDEAKHLLLSVTDNGPGIPEAERARLFDQFFRGSTSTGIPGCGIGLHLVSHFVRLHQGEINVESTEGEGTAFTVSIPLVDQQAHLNAATAA